MDASRPRRWIASCTGAARCVLFASLGVACGVLFGGPANGQETQAESDRLNVLLLTVDCLRPDHLSLHGYARPTSPNLDAFARDAWVFENAFATSSWTSPGVVSMLTGYYPPVHAQNAKHSYYDEGLSSALRALVEAGYVTYGTGARGPNYGGIGLQVKAVPRGDFEVFVRARAAERANAQEPRPFFAWLHTREPHLPYRPTPANAGRFAEDVPDSPGVAAVREHHFILRDPTVDVPYEHPGAVRFQPGDAEAIRALYDETVRDADDHLGRTFRALSETGLLEQTIVIVSADHGEELLEHGWIGHASTGYDGKLTDELVRIPLIVRVPGLGGGRSDALVQGVDLMPSLLEWLGLAGSFDPPLQGVSWVPLTDGRRRWVREHVFMQTTRKGWTTPLDEMPKRVTAVRDSTRKLVWFPAEGDEPARMEAYDLQADPGEQRAVFAVDPERFRDLRRARSEWDARNLLAARRLLMPSGRAHAVSVHEALAEGDTVAALDAWRRFFMLHRTWGAEEAPFYADDASGGEWRALHRETTQALSEALSAEAGGGPAD